MLPRVLRCQTSLEGFLFRSDSIGRRSPLWLARQLPAAVQRTESVPHCREAVDTLCGCLYSQSQSFMSASVRKIQIGQLWKNDGTGDIYLVTRLYSEALNTMVILRKSGAEDEKQIRVRVERAAGGQKIPGFSPAQGDERF
jgi:hypothetical protein